MARGPDGSHHYLCKRYPAVFDLLLRGFAPGIVRALFRRRLHRYEMRDLVDAAPPREVFGIPALSGAFMISCMTWAEFSRRLSASWRAVPAKTNVPRLNTTNNKLTFFITLHKADLVMRRAVMAVHFGLNS